MRSVLITGASSGIGEACALRLDRAGWRVVAGVRREEDGRRLAARASSGLQWVILDVTAADQIAAAAGRIGEQVGEAGLDGLVNNAGIAVGGPLELVPIDTLRHQLEVNVVGLVAVTQALLPLLRRSRGRIVNIGSISGLIASPLVGPYSASKFAVEALSDALRLELAAWGVATIVIEPGMVRTPIWDKGTRALDRRDEQYAEEDVRRYAGAFRAMERILRRAGRVGIEPDRVARVVERALTARRPRARYLVSADARVRLLLYRVLPRRWMDALVLRVLRRLGEAG